MQPLPGDPGERLKCPPYADEFDVMTPVCRECPDDRLAGLQQALGNAIGQPAQEEEVSARKARHENANEPLPASWRPVREYCTVLPASLLVRGDCRAGCRGPRAGPHARSPRERGPGSRAAACLAGR
ncbi:hypothetical protein ACFV8T_30750 [Streptomyces sp. NPDC059832]|uniref:hypothetical protein n=1 Tax=Streptomyces sp. NPDC059832 TaxID=3346966 RepID=UPI0036530584